MVIVSSGREMILRDIREGEYFGHYSAIDGKSRSAAIVAVNDSVVARMSAAGLLGGASTAIASVREGVLKDLVGDIRTANQRAHEQANFDVKKAALRRTDPLVAHHRRGPGRRISRRRLTPNSRRASARTARLSPRRFPRLEREGMISRSPSAIVLMDAARLRRVLAVRHVT